MLKRGFDIGVSIAVLTATVPLTLVVAILTKLTSPGPILYRPIRTGRDGVRFRPLKFRTMVDNAEKLGGFSTADQDSRVTWIGAILRRYKIDELPQLVNVIRGEMSLVGPRPEVVEYTEMYTEEEREILSIRPGITDYASIEYMHLERVLGTEDPDRVYLERVWPRKIELRLRYVRKHTFFKDLWIISRSVLAALK